MKRLVGTFRTEEEAILAINDLKDMGLDASEISVVTNQPHAFRSIEESFDLTASGKTRVGNVYHGEGVHHFVHTLGEYGIPEDKAKFYADGLHEGNILVFIGLNKEIRHHIDNPGTYRAPDLFIEDIETPGTFNISGLHTEEPDTPGKYTAEEFGNEPTNPGTYVDPQDDGVIRTPGTITEEEVTDPYYDTDIIHEEVEVDVVTEERELEDKIDKEKATRTKSVDELDPFEPDRPLY